MTLTATLCGPSSQTPTPQSGKAFTVTPAGTEGHSRMWAGRLHGGPHSCPRSQLRENNFAGPASGCQLVQAWRDKRAYESGEPRGLAWEGSDDYGTTPGMGL